MREKKEILTKTLLITGICASWAAIMASGVFYQFGKLIGGCVLNPLFELFGML